jgi:hypothetical protein
MASSDRQPTGRSIQFLHQRPEPGANVHSLVGRIRFAPRRSPRAPNGLTLLLNRHDLSDLGSLASASTPESAAAKSHPQRVEQAVEQPVEQPLEQPVEPPLEQPVERPLEQPLEQDR